MQLYRVRCARARLRTVQLFLVFLLSLPTAAICQSPLDEIRREQNYCERVTVNESFEANLLFWNLNKGSAQVIPWNQLPPDPANPRLTSNQLYLTQPDDVVNSVPNEFALKLTGASSIYQLGAINGQADYQLIICNARKRRIDGTNGPLGWAGYGVTYFDENWNFITSKERQILDVKAFSPGFPPGYSQSSTGFAIPPGARFAALWIANDGENTELYADDLALFNFFVGEPNVDSSQPIGNQFTQDQAEINLLLNGAFSSQWRFDYPDGNDLTAPIRFTRTGNDPFWQSFGAKRDPLWGAFVTADSSQGTGEGAYWQNVVLTPGTEYDLSFVYSGSGQFTFGIDIYNQNWDFVATNRIEADGVINVRFPSGFQASRQRIRFTAPENGRNASVWIWFGPTNSFSNRLDVYQAILRPVIVAE